MKKFRQQYIFEMDDDFMSLSLHRVYINSLIEKGIIDQYVVSMETQRLWITTMSGEDKADVEKRLKKSPVHKYWNTIEIDELFVIDGQHYKITCHQID